MGMHKINEIMPFSANGDYLVIAGNKVIHLEFGVIHDTFPMEGFKSPTFFEIFNMFDPLEIGDIIVKSGKLIAVTNTTDNKDFCFYGYDQNGQGHWLNSDGFSLTDYTKALKVGRINP